MTRLAHRLLAAALLVTALAVVLPTLATATGSGATSSTRMTNTAASPSPAPSPSCGDCLTADDVICWESVPYKCYVPITDSRLAIAPITVSFRTVAMTAKPQVDYYDVLNGTVVIPAGAQVGYAVISLVPNPQLPKPKTFGVQFFDPSCGVLVRSQALVTIERTRW